VADGVLQCEQAAPGLPQQHVVTPVEPERLADLLDLMDEPFQRPQRRVVAPLDGCRIMERAGGETLARPVIYLEFQAEIVDWCQRWDWSARSRVIRSPRAGRRALLGARPALGARESLPALHSAPGNAALAGSDGSQNREPAAAGFRLRWATPSHSQGRSSAWLAAQGNVDRLLRPA
jgi:hypothetical protein